VVTFELVGKGLNGIGGCYLQKIDVYRPQRETREVQ